jgi:hypothetical protein
MADRGRESRSLFGMHCGNRKGQENLFTDARHSLFDVCFVHYNEGTLH